MAKTSTRCRSQIDRWLLLACVLAITLLGATWRTCDASPTFGRRQQISGAQMFKRKVQSWLIHHRSHSKTSNTMRQRMKHLTKKNAIDRTKQRGSFMTSQRPTKERLYRWFGVEGEDLNQLMRCMMMRNEFNHNLCGITNPFLKILKSSKLEQHARDTNDGSSYPRSQIDRNRKRIVRPFSKVMSRSNNLSDSITLDTSSIDVDKSWWPSLQITQNSNMEQQLFQGKNNHNNRIDTHDTQNSGFKQKDWRILTYRKRVGRGRDCYKKVRDAALDWEFQSTDGSTGMMQVPDSSPICDDFESHSKSKRSYSVQPASVQSDATQFSSPLYRSLGSRRLVSYASKPISKFLPSFLQRRIYSINPVMVVYDLVDQRAPDGETTFTSTAYATLRGHFLRGEERVTVALRDGSQDVEVEIMSISRAGPGLLGKTLWPFIGKMQSSFFQQQLDHLDHSGRAIDSTNSMIEVVEGNIPKLL